DVPSDRTGCANLPGFPVPSLGTRRSGPWSRVLRRGPPVAGLRSRASGPATVERVSTPQPSAEHPRPDAGPVAGPAAGPDVAPEAHGERVASMFDGIASRYDLMNLVMTWGQEPRFVRRTVERAELPDAPVVLDLATGTGDIALEVLRR